MRSAITVSATTIVASIATLLAISACSTTEEEDGTALAIARYAATDNEPSGDAAILEGQIRSIDGCLVIEDQLGQTVMPIVEARDARLDERAAGDSSPRLTGGGREARPSSALLPSECEAVDVDSYWIVVPPA